MKQNNRTIRLKTPVILIVGLALCILSSCVEKESEVLFTGTKYQNILQFIDANPDKYTKFRALIKDGKLEDVLSSYNSHLGGNNYSLFLPNDQAVDAFLTENNYGSVDELLKDTTYVKNLVRYHLLNRQIQASDFPNGALNATTLTNDFLTVNFSIDESGNIDYKINNEARVLTENILKSNGIIHEIDKMLTPKVFTAYEWIQNNKANGYQIFAELLETTGLQDTLNYFEMDFRGFKNYPGYTLFAESDLLYKQNGINSLTDLIAMISPDNDDYLDRNNALNQYATYHILESRVFLDQFQTQNYNTYGNLPISVGISNDGFRFNAGTEVFETIINGPDTIQIDYLELDINASNILTKTGPIHHLNRLLRPFRPGLVTVQLEFYNEPVIDYLRHLQGTFRLNIEDLKKMSLIGPDQLLYTKSITNIQDVPSNDYITITGNFEFTYTTPRILSGSYELRLIANRNSSANAMVQVLVNDQKVGGIVDLTSGSTSASRAFNPSFLLGIITFDQSTTHEIKIKTIKPGNLILDRIELTPVNK